MVVHRACLRGLPMISRIHNGNLQLLWSSMVADMHENDARLRSASQVHHRVGPMLLLRLEGILVVKSCRAR